jgi:hypothetical protein
VLFYANAMGNTFIPKDTFVPTGVPGLNHPVRLPLRFTLKMNVDTTGDWLAPRPPAPVVFDMTANSIAHPAHVNGDRPTRLYHARRADETWVPSPESVDDRQAVRAYQESIFPAQQAAIHKAAGFEVPIDVRWDAIALPDEGERYSDQDFWTNVFFVPLAQALSEVTSNSAGKQAVRDKLNKIVVTFDKATAAAGDNGVWYYKKGINFEDGVLTLNFQPYINRTALPRHATGIEKYIKERAQAIREALEEKL